MTIESVQNEKIKKLSRLLAKNSERKKAGILIVEGRQENQRASRFGYEPVEFFISEALYNEALPAGRVHLVSEQVYEKIAYRGTTEGIIGIYKIPTADIDDYTPAADAFVIVLESVEKPGNLGAILRSCEAFGVDAVIVTDPKIDLYNPNVIRSSVGCIFGMRTYALTNQQTLDFLQRNDFQILTTFMEETARTIDETKLSGRAAICFGTEHSGLSEFWNGKGQNVLVPMAGSIDSLNLSNAVAICAYEQLRQKRT